MSAIANREIVFNKLEQALPPVFSREEAARHLGGVLKAKTLSNIDADGKGPPVKIRIGKKVAYERGSFLRWLKQYKSIQ